jgi:hypothetical protein
LCRSSTGQDGACEQHQNVREIKAKSLALGHVPIIDPHPHLLAEEVRYNERSAAERVNGGLRAMTARRSAATREGRGCEISRFPR